MLKLSFIDKTLIIFILIGLFGIFNLYGLHYNYKDILISLGEKEIKRVSYINISEAVNKEISLYKDESFIIEKDNSKMEFDSISLTNISNNIIAKMNEDLFFNKMNIFEVPIGYINKNILLNANGPNIPICFRYFGETKCELKCEIDNYSINTVIVKIVLYINMNAQMILPLLSKNIPIQNSYPIVIELIQGEVPDVYFGEYPVLSN
ncbi:MAG: hypothetical protein IJV94_03115 [Bacilli bacterium]|nr:hypothetical protein [Bacilli bacterium]